MRLASFAGVNDCVENSGQIVNKSGNLLSREVNRRNERTGLELLPCNQRRKVLCISGLKSKWRVINGKTINRLG
jgi:hypothetical protein